MKHRGYRLLSEQLAGIARKAKLINLPKKKRNIEGLLKAVGAMFEYRPELRGTMDCLVTAEEVHWMQTGRRVYFLEDLGIAHSIQRGSYNITSAAPLYQGAESFILMLPEGLAFAGNTKGSGLLVTVFRHVDRGDDIFNAFFDAIGQPRVDVVSVGDMGDFTVCVCYQQGERAHEYYRMATPSHSIEACIAMDNYSDYAAYQAKHNKFDFIGGIDLDLAESEYQYDIFRLVVGFLIYRAALPDRIIEGLPGVGVREATSQYVKRVNAAHIKHPKGHHSSPDGHYRTWHFRQLMADRYYQGEHKGKEKGSRVVFVQDSFIGDISAATAT